MSASLVITCGDRQDEIFETRPTNFNFFQLISDSFATSLPLVTWSKDDIGHLKSCLPPLTGVKVNFKF